MRFHLIDRIKTWQAGQFIKARKLTCQSEEYWHFNESGPVMPEPLILEAFCQAGAWLIFISTEGCKRATLLSLGAVEFSGVVKPGQVLDVEVHLSAISEEVAAITGLVSVAGRTVLVVQEILCALAVAGDLEDPEETMRMQRLLTRGAA